MVATITQITCDGPDCKNTLQKRDTGDFIVRTSATTVRSATVHWVQHRIQIYRRNGTKNDHTDTIKDLCPACKIKELEAAIRMIQSGVCDLCGKFDCAGHIGEGFQ